MNKYIKAFAATMSVLVLTSSLAACGNKTTSSKEITVWSRLNGSDKEVEAVNKAAQEWATKNGKKVKVVSDKSEFQAFLQAANSSQGPDVVFGVPHDNLGTFYKANLLAEVPSGLIDKSKYNQRGIESVSFDNKLYGAPISIETALLFINTDKVKEAPKTFEELREKAKTLGFKYDINNIYFSFPFVAANGGYVFKSNNGVPDVNDVGMGNEGAIKGYQILQDLVQKDKLMPADIKGDMAKGEFQNGNTAFYIGGPWDIDGFKEAGVKFQAVPYPTLNGNPMPAFVGVQTAFVNAKSTANKDDCFALMNYLVENTQEALFDINVRVPALNSVAESSKIKDNAVAKAVLDQAKNGVVMPNVPEVQSMWKVNDSMSLLTSGQLSATDFAKKVLADIKQGIQQQK
ncbi:MAG: maltose ABC transporter substrate-binding protein [Clostridiaceae bacterium]